MPAALVGHLGRREVEWPPASLKWPQLGGKDSCQQCPCTQIWPLRESLCEGTRPWSLLPGLYVFSSRSGVSLPMEQTPGLWFCKGQTRAGHPLWGGSLLGVRQGRGRLNLGEWRMERAGHVTAAVWTQCRRPSIQSLYVGRCWIHEEGTGASFHLHVLVLSVLLTQLTYKPAPLPFLMCLFLHREPGSPHLVHT